MAAHAATGEIFVNKQIESQRQLFISEHNSGRLPSPNSLEVITGAPPPPPPRKVITPPHLAAIVARPRTRALQADKGDGVLCWAQSGLFSVRLRRPLPTCARCSNRNLMNTLGAVCSKLLPVGAQLGHSHLDLHANSAQEGMWEKVRQRNQTQDCEVNILLFCWTLLEWCT
ncbi:uncharacterized protein LOC144025958 [Festucalex cinctus]